MPRSLKLCSAPGCTSVAGQCPKHQRAPRPSSAKRGYGKSHRDRFRAGVLARDRLCRVCLTEPATVADHWPRSRRELVKLGLDPDDPIYGRGLCERCHGRETAKNQPGGFNAPR